MYLALHSSYTFKEAGRSAKMQATYLLSVLVLVLGIADYQGMISIDYFTLSSYFWL